MGALVRGCVRMREKERACKCARETHSRKLFFFILTGLSAFGFFTFSFPHSHRHALHLTLTLPPTLLSEIGSWGPEDRFWCFSCPSDANRGFVSKQQKLKVRERAAAAAAASVQPRQGTSARLRKLNRPKEKEEKQRPTRNPPEPVDQKRDCWFVRQLWKCRSHRFLLPSARPARPMSTLQSK